MNNQTVSRRYWIHYTHTVQFDCWCCQYAYKFYFLFNNLHVLSAHQSNKKKTALTIVLVWLLWFTESKSIESCECWLFFFFVNNKTIDHIHATDLGEKTVHSNSCLNNWTWIGNKSEIQHRWIQARYRQGISTWFWWFSLACEKEIKLVFLAQYQANRSENWICTFSILAKVKAKKNALASKSWWK